MRRAHPFPKTRRAHILRESGIAAIGLLGTAACLAAFAIYCFVFLPLN